MGFGWLRSFTKEMFKFKSVTLALKGFSEHISQHISLSIYQMLIDVKTNPYVIDLQIKNCTSSMHLLCISC